ncbi:mitochondrial F1-F0 ATP synthase subunit F of fungi-domain-containing protein [Dipodascopsis tothii]|uniref:mitochondrial F1-F0 ATP synthase subunit F of fungi-domain-containing protein n=1 Tax=Dipodascopsis tothii TaxID=44089 RepID=UPI0034CE06A8
MSFIAKRSLSTLIPPKIASAANLGSTPNAKRLTNVVGFYKALPRGAASPIKPKGPIGWYKAKYFDGEKASGAPLLHAVLSILLLGYSLEYYTHLRHHKGGEH